MTKVYPYAEQGNYTQFHNANFDHVMPFVSGTAWKILCLIIRKTKGWQKDEDDIAYSQLKKGTGIKSDATIKKGIDELLDFGVIQVGKARHQADPNAYRLDKSFSCRTSKNEDSTPKKWSTGTSKNEDTKDTTTKESIKEKESPSPIEELVTLFADKTNLRIPKNGTLKDNWLEPLVAIYKASSEDFETTKERVIVATGILKEKGYPVYSPGSIQNTAVNLDIHPAKPAYEVPQGEMQMDELGQWSFVTNG